jgi:hypothetical protein
LIEPIPVFIVHWNKPESCGRSIEAFLSQGIPVRIVILDNGSEPAKLSYLYALIDNRAVIRELGRNMGFGGALNIALKDWLSNSQEPYAVVAAHDALPMSGCIVKLITVLNMFPRVGIVSPEYGIGHKAQFSALRGPYLVPHPRGSGFEPQAYAHGTLMCIRRECLQDIGLFDERYFAYGDEIDLALRAWHHGWEVGVVWGAIVDNPETSVPSPVACYLQLRNACLLVRNWKGWHWGLVRCMVALGGTCLGLIIPSRRTYHFSTTARFLAIMHALMGHYGPPPPFLSTLSERKRFSA